MNRCVLGVTTLLSLSSSGCPGPLVAPTAEVESEPESPPDAPSRTPEIPVARVPSGPTACTDTSAGNAPELARRLTAQEYYATVTAAVGVEGDLELLAREARIQGHTNDYGTLIPAQQTVVGLAEFGADLAERLLSADRAWLGHPPCAIGASDCVEVWVSEVAEALFRRPLLALEARSFGELFDRLAAEGRSADQAAVGTLRALLMSPQAIYRLEAPGETQVTPLEMASRLSFFVTGAGPDATLREAARSGALESSQQIEAQVRRLVRTPAARSALDQLTYGWLHLNTLETLTPTGDEEFDAEIVRSAQDLVQAVWLEDEAPLRDVFSADFIVPASARAARQLRAEDATPGQRYATGEDPLRAGLLTEPAVLAGTGGDGFPLIHRALFIYKDVLCRVVPDPPEGVTDAQPGSPTASRREKAESRAQSPACAGCHQAFDPLAYALEPFSFSGEHHEVDEFGHPTRTDGAFVDAEGVSRAYQTPAEFAQLLASDRRVDPCILRRIVRSAWGRALDGNDACALTQIQERFEQLGSSYTAALIAVATHASFAIKGR
ncbi:MAG: DUF1592 domain-containing protein [Myxococcota bacterium]